MAESISGSSWATIRAWTGATQMYPRSRDSTIPSMTSTASV